MRRTMPPKVCRPEIETGTKPKSREEEEVEELQYSQLKQQVQVRHKMPPNSSRTLLVQSSSRRLTVTRTQVKEEKEEIEVRFEETEKKHSSALDFEEWSMHLPHFVDLDTVRAAGSEKVRELYQNSFTKPEASDFKVRGPDYLTGHKKTKNASKIASEESPYSVVGVQVFHSKKSLEHIASKVESLKEYIRRHTPSKANSSGIPEFLVVTWMFKSTWSREYTSVVHLFRRKADTDVDVEHPKSGFDRAFKTFLDGDDKVKRNKFKFAFQIIEAPSALRKTVKVVGGERPVLIGKALTTSFFQTDSYLEIDQDVGSSFLASSLNSSILKAAANICVTTSWIIEAQEEDELPERLLGSVQWNYVDPKAAYIELDENFNVVNL